MVLFSLVFGDVGGQEKNSGHVECYPPPIPHLFN